MLRSCNSAIGDSSRYRVFNKHRIDLIVSFWDDKVAKLQSVALIASCLALDCLYVAIQDSTVFYSQTRSTLTRALDFSILFAICYSVKGLLQ